MVVLIGRYKYNIPSQSAKRETNLVHGRTKKERAEALPL